MDLRNGPKTSVHSHNDCRGIWKCLELHLHILKYEFAHMYIYIYTHCMMMYMCIYMHVMIYHKAFQYIIKHYNALCDIYDQPLHDSMCSKLETAFVWLQLSTTTSSLKVCLGLVQIWS